MAVVDTDLSTLALFDGCLPGDLEFLSAAVTGVREIAEGSALCREGEAADRWWIVVDGMAEVTVGGLFVATIGPGESVGELALLDGEPRNGTVTAVTDLVVQEVDGAGFVEALAGSPHLSMALLRQLATRLRHANELRAGRAGGVAAPAATGGPEAAAGGPEADARGPEVEAETEAVAFNPFAPGYFANPYDQYASLRRHAPVLLEPMTGAFILTRYADVHDFTRDRSMLVEIARASPTPAVEAEMARNAAAGGLSERMMLVRDGEDHTRLRRLVSKVFTPKAVGSWRARAEAVVETLLDAAAARQSVDVIADYALLLPAQIISEMLGMPHGDIPQLRQWSHALTKTLDPLNSPEEEAASIAAGRAMTTYIEAVVADKRSHPGDDILTALISAEESGDRLGPEELVAQVVLLYVAGHETTLNLVGNGLTHLFEFPDQLDRLRTDPGLDANAIEELLRFDSPVQFARRIAVEPMRIDEVDVPAGAVVLLGLGAANRDPAKWGATADAVELARPGANEHASFGGGSHYCLGASLARLEAQVSLPRLVRRFPRLVPEYDEPAWGARMILRGVERLPVGLRNA